MAQPFIYAEKSISTTEVQRIPMLFMNMRWTRLKWMSGVDWRELSHWTMFLHRGYSHRTCVSGHVTEICYWLTSARIDFPARWGTAPLSSTGACLLECKFSRYVDRKRRTTCLATQVTRFDPFGFLWGFVKNVVYQGDRTTTLEQLRGHITNAAALVTPQKL